MNIQYVEICNVIKFKLQKCINHITMTIFKSQIIKIKIITKFNKIHIPPRKTLTSKVKCNYNIYMFCSLFLSIAFYLLLEGKSKRGSKGRGEITLLVVKRGEENGLFVQLGFIWS